MSHRLPKQLGKSTTAMADRAATNNPREKTRIQFPGGFLLIFPVLLMKKIWHKLKRLYRQWFCQQNYIFRHQGPFDLEYRTDCSYMCYKSFDELPEPIKNEIRADGSADRLNTDKQELDENAFLWVAFVNGRVATTVFTRKGTHFRRWFLDLQPNDVVVFRLRTHPDFRGRGIAPSLIRYALCHAMTENGHAYIDCRTYNKPSKRCIEKAGFECVAVKKTITREWALYD